MSQIDIEHKHYEFVFKNPVYKKHIKNGSPIIRHSLFTAMNSSDEQIVKTYLKWIISKSKKKYYLLPLEGNAIIALVKNDFKSFFRIRYCSELTPTAVKVFNNQYRHAIEIVNLHSFKKGEGSKILEELNSLLYQVKIPLALYTEKPKLVDYYERHGFINQGMCGDNKEYFMIKLPLV